ncbi:MAG: hypothetical protein OXI25_04465 [Chloroflexota bacterium]|nr:hypothetical protein [Chloroflexota bacterium]
METAPRDQETEPPPEAPPRPDEPGAGLRTAGGVLLGLAIPTAVITYVLVFSPMAPGRYYRSIAGIAEATADLGTFLLSLLAALVIPGLALYLWGLQKEKRARR